MIIYRLEHARVLREDGTRETKLIGVYDSVDKCLAALERLKGKPGFVDYPDGFEIDEFELNKDELEEPISTTN